MDRAAEIERLFAYDDWANRETLASLRAAGSGERGARILAHVIGAERLWHARLEGSTRAAEVWPAHTLDRCADEIAGLESLWEEYLEDLDDDDLGQAVDYVNSKGERWKSTVGDILTHVVLHSAYHRGQIAALVRESGREPAATDFIHCVRRGFLE